MFKYFLLLFLVVAVSAYAMDDSALWVKAFKNLTISSVEQTFDGGYIASATKVMDSSTNAVLIRLDASGKVTWARSFGGSEYELSATILQTVDGGFLFSGSQTGYPWLLKLDGTGNIVWQRIYKSSKISAFPPLLLQAADGGFFLVGSISARSGGSHYSDVSCMKLNADGAILWQKAYGQSKSDQEIFAAAATPDGGLIFVGESSNFPLAVKVNSTGSITWRSVYTIPDYVPNPHAANAFAVANLTDGGYVIGGTFDNDAWVAKLCSKGKPVWHRTFHSEIVTRVGSVRQEKDGHILVMGQAAYASTSDYGVYLNHIWSVRLDSNGKVAWQKMFGEQSQTSGDSVSAIHATPDDGTVFVGSRQVQSGANSRVDAIVGRTSAAGTVCKAFQTAVTVTNDVSSLNAKSLQIGSRKTNYAMQSASLPQSPVAMEVVNLCGASK